MWTRRRVHVHRAHAAQEFLSAHLSKAFVLAEFLVYQEEGQSDSERKHEQKLQSRELLVEFDIWFFLFFAYFYSQNKDARSGLYNNWSIRIAPSGNCQVRNKLG